MRKEEFTSFVYVFVIVFLILFVLFSVSSFILGKFGVYSDSERDVRKGPVESVLIDGLVSYYSFDSGDARDDSGNGRDGTVSGATLISEGKFESAYEFDGVDDYIKIGEGSDFSDLCVNGCTFSAWVNKEDTFDSNEFIVARQRASEDDRFFVFYTNNLDRLRIDIHENGDDTKCRTWSTPGSFPYSQWVHVVGVYDLSSVVLYENNVEVARSSCSFSEINEAAWQDNEDTFIGKAAVSGNFNGKIDEVMIFNRALTTQEITDVYNNNFDLGEEVGEESCVESWQCGNWSSCMQGLQTRSCNDVNSCGTVNSKPVESQSCVVGNVSGDVVAEESDVDLPEIISDCTENWQCGEWKCYTDIGIEERDCFDLNDCGTYNNEPIDERNCELIEQTQEIVEEIVSEEGVECKFTRVDWTDANGNIIKEVVDGQTVYLTVESSGCNGKTVEFTTFETDGVFGKDERQALSGMIRNGKASIPISVNWEPDSVFFGLIKGDPEFVFEAETNPSGSSGLLSVSEGVRGLAASTCGNNIVEMGEACDGSDLNGNACTTLPGFVSGTLSCKSDCSGFIVTSCNAGNTINAASCNQGDVQSAINSASDGDTVLVPAGDCTWSSTAGSGLKGIVLKGAGIDNTIIRSSGSQLLALSNHPGHAPTQLEGFTFDNAGFDLNPLISLGHSDDNAWLLAPALNQFRVTKIKIINGRGRGIRVSLNSARIGGVIDNSIFEWPGSGGSKAISIFGDEGAGDLSEAPKGQNPFRFPLESGSARFIFVENNIFDFGAGNDGASDAYSGARYVFRYNNVIGTNVGHHGADSGNFRGTMTMEIYGNWFDCANRCSSTGGSGGRKLNFRSGTGVVFNNTFTGGYGNADLINYRSDESHPPWGICDGTGAYDGNLVGSDRLGPIQPGYPCLDQIGHKFTENSGGANILIPLFEWDNFEDGADVDFTVSTTNHPPSDQFIKDTRDYYGDTVTYNEGTGMYEASYLEADDVTLTNWEYKPFPSPHPLVQLDAPAVSCSIPADCDDLLFCNGVEDCVGGFCQAGVPPVIDDGFSCTIDSCDEVNDVVVNAPNNALCDDSNTCTIDTCDPSDPGADANGCLLDFSTTEGNACGDDGHACTTGEQCLSGVCTPTSFDDATCLTENPACTSATCGIGGCGSFVPLGCNIPQGLVAHYKLDDGSGTIAVDSAGTNDGVLNNFPASPWTPSGQIIGALSFDGFDDFVDVPTTNWIEYNFSVALWAKANAFSGSSFMFGHTTVPTFGSRIQIYTNDALGLLDIGIGDTHALDTDIVDLDLGVWHHIALTLSGIGGGFGGYNVYLDGAPVSSGAYTGMLAIGNANIGNNADFGAEDEAFAGDIDDVRIYDKALSASEVLSLYTSASSCTDGQTRACPLTLGVCAGAVETCTGSAWPGCGAAEYGVNYEVNELTCDGALDNDCDGISDALDTDCFVCGNGVIEGSEVCDGANLGGETCVSQGFDSGTLACVAPGLPGECGFDFSSCVSSSNVFYVDINDAGCSDTPGAGSVSNPWCTLSYAVGQITGGDDIFVKTGIYPGTFTITGLVASSSDWSEIKVFPGHSVTLLGSGNSGRWKISGGQYILFDGFEITNVQQGFFVEGGAQFITLQNLHVHQIYQEAIHVRQTSDNVVIQNNLIHDTGLGSFNSEGVYIGTGSAGPNDNSGFCIIRNNTIFNAPDEAIELKPGTHDCIVEGNHIYNSGSDLPSGVGNIEVGPHTHSTGVPFWGSNPNHIIRNNIIHDSQGGTGIYLSTGGSVYNNIIYDMINTGITINNEQSDSYTRFVYHNTIDTSSGSAIQESGGTRDIRNNIGPSNAGNIVTSPGLYVSVVEGSEDYHLVASASAAIDTGADLSGIVDSDFDGVSRPQGAGFDMGAYEFAAAGSNIPSIVSVDAIPDVDLNPSVASSVVFNFVAEDLDGVGNLMSSGSATFSRVGEPNRVGTCSGVSDLGNQRTYQCTVNMQYFDEAGVWNVDVSADDNDGNTASDSSQSFVVNLLQDISITPSGFSFPSVDIGNTDILASSTTIVTNNGNYEGAVQVTGHNLHGVVSANEFLDAGLFRAGVDSGVCTSGNDLVNGTAVSVVGSSLARGASATEELHYCLTNVPVISTQQYDTLSGYGWVIRQI